MKLANLAGRLAIVTDDRAIDVATASRGVFDADPQAIYARWSEFTTWATDADFSAGSHFDPTDLQAAVPAPRQFFAIGLNYRDHAEETNTPLPPAPMVFTKFQSAIAGPRVDIPIVSDTVDYEAEMCVVISQGGRNIDAADAMAHVAGIAIGQDISDRGTQLAGPAPQFSLGKSHAGYAPVGPWLVTLDEVGSIDNLAIRTEVRRAGRQNLETLQNGNTSDLIFSVPELIAYLSRFVEMLPGDVIMTGTPAGVAMAGGRYLEVGDVLVTSIEGVGSMESRCVSPGCAS
ncbi:MAG: fumarylacetoacetate hydrolase family protein [Microbacterium ginsengisoli]|nr:fumarylacetoacetate hydrolase family protein [Microbacterium ginsengisoli]